ncbi:MAG: glycosyltransferase family 39 protein [Bacteroidia bacterium]|nr:glycosyltransferase family 39 protein [Bacteroidia bacterium]
MIFLPGYLVLLISVLLFLAAFYFRKKTVFSLFLLIIGGLFLRLYLSSDTYLHEWDERYHALVAKNLLKHPLVPTLYDNPVLPANESTWVDGHVWLHKQPLPLWIMATSLKVVGCTEFGLRFPSVLLSTLAILLTFLISKELFSKKTAFLSAFLHAIHGMVIELTAGRIATDHVDVFFLFFIELAIYFAVLFRKKDKQYFNLLTGVCIGLAVLCKWLPAFIVLALWFVINYRHLKWQRTLASLVIIVLSSAAVFVPWQIYIITHFPVEAKREYAYNLKHMSEVLDGNGGPFYYYFDKMRIIFGELIYIPFIWLMYKFFKRYFSVQRAFLLLWILIPYLFFSFAKTKMQAYIIFCAPAFFILTAYFIQYLSFIKFKPKLKIVSVIFSVLLLALPVRYCFERMKFFDSNEKNTVWVIELKDLNSKLPANAIVFNHPNAIEGMFYTDFVFYSKIPSLAEIDLIKSKGYAIAIFTKRALPQEIKNVPGVIYLN